MKTTDFRKKKRFEKYGLIKKSVLDQCKKAGMPRPPDKILNEIIAKEYDSREANEKEEIEKVRMELLQED